MKVAKKKYSNTIIKKLDLLSLHKKICLQFRDKFSKTSCILNFRTEGTKQFLGLEIEEKIP